MTPRRFARLFGPFICSFVVGCALTRWYPCSWPLQEIVRVLRDALIVAGVIGPMIEVWAASSLIEEATEELSSRLVGYGLPRDAQNLIYKLVHETKLVYRNYRKAYRLTESEKPGKVIVHVTLSYRVVNNGKRTETYAPSFAEEGMYNPVVIKLEYRDKTVVPQMDEDEKTGVVSFMVNKKVKIAPSHATEALEQLTKEQYCDVRWEYRIEMPNYYSDVTAFVGITVQPTLEVLSSPSDLAFDAGNSDECAHAEGGSTWEYKRAFVAGQHIRAWWKPRD
ncbi:MAG TPA: hypothetical protein VN777_06920 [Terriglobales bacterium]|nr:hypothetical protein [Terriglobales bacterium]